MIHHLRRIRSITWLRLGVGLFLLIFLLVLLPYGAIREFLTFDNIVAWVKTARASGWTLTVFFIVYTFAVLGLPVTLFPIIGGVLFPFGVAFPVNVAAATVGSMLAFGISRLFGREVVHMLLRGWGKSLDKLAAHEGLKSVVIIRWIGIPPFVLANYAFGLSGVRPRDYFLGTLIGIAPWTALITYLADLFWQAALVGGEKGLVKAVMATMFPLSLVSLAMAVGLLAMYLYRKKNKALQPHSNL